MCAKKNSSIRQFQKLLGIKRKKKSAHKIGLPPGSLIYTGDKKQDKVTITLISYDNQSLHEEVVEFSNLKDHPMLLRNVIWVDIVGLHDAELLEELGKFFGIHKLTLEDIVSTDQRPKLEVFEDYLFATLKMIQCPSPESPIDEEQISFILKNNILFTFQEKKGDVFQFVRIRLSDPKRPIRQRGADYLLYALLDAVIDNYFIVLENVGERIEDLESQAMINPGNEVLNSLYAQRREIMDLRRSIYPLREVVGSFNKYAEHQISEEVKPFIRDLYENTVQVVETMEIFRDMAAGVLDLYMNIISNRMNNVMKVLTIISTIFIPLSFVAGVYGMNFDNMPELHWKYGYFYVLGGMGISVVGMLIFFRFKKWL